MNSLPPSPGASGGSTRRLALMGKHGSLAQVQTLTLAVLRGGKVVPISILAGPDN